jgi:hypothetical protein
MAVKRFDLPEREEDTWDFLCECGAAECKEWVTMAVSEYTQLQRRRIPILAPGHSLDQVQRTRRMARRRVEEAQALRAQAEHQLKRARRNLEKTDGE